MKADDDYMRKALEQSAKGVKKGQTPFGACIVGKDGKVIACSHNKVWQEKDITSHAEVVTIREACRKTGKVKFEGATIYSTTEPCPMCFSAIHWAGIRRIVFGSEIDDARKAGFSELTISNEQMKKLGGSPVEISPGVLEKECRQQFKDWLKTKDHKVY